MRLLVVDVGTGTQDILLFDSERQIENCFQMVMPSPTILVARRVRRATAAGQDLFLTGRIMGGGPCHWATMDHLRAGYRVFATPAAAQTFDDDLDRVREMGIELVEEGAFAEGDERVCRIELRDFDFEAIRAALAAFDVEPAVDGLALAVFDHGAAPPGYSDRRFRFDYLSDRLAQGEGLAGFAFWREEVPDRFTRLQAAADSAPSDLPTLIMDTAPAAILGALEDPQVSRCRSVVVTNVGNFHCLAFHLVEGEIVGLFEHHTGELTREALVAYLRKLAAGTLTNAEVFEDMGHGALVLNPEAPAPERFAVVGPRRRMLEGGDLPVYQAVPHGDMMLAGCFGLLRAYAQKDPVHGPKVAAVLDGTAPLGAPW